MKKTPMMLLCITTAVGFIACNKTVQETALEPARPVMAGTAPATPVYREIIKTGTLRLSKARSRMALATVGSKVLFAGGLDINIERLISPGNPVLIGGAHSTVDIYDTATHTWSIAQLSEASYGKAAVTVGNKVLFAGGYTSTQQPDGKVIVKPCGTVDIYDGATGSWSSTRLRVPRSNIAAVAYGNKAYFAGGATAQGNADSDVIDVYNVQTNSWTELKLRNPRHGAAAVANGGKVYVISGARSIPAANTTAPEYSVEVLDTLTNTLTAAADVRYPKTNMGAVCYNNVIYMAAGEPHRDSPPQADTTGFKATRIEFRSLAGPDAIPNWTKFPPELALQRPRTQGTWLANANFLIMAGGQDTASTVEYREMRTGSYVWDMKISAGGRFTSAVALGNKVYVAGGYLPNPNLPKPQYPPIIYTDAVDVLELR